MLGICDATGKVGLTGYLAKVTCPNGLITNYNKVLQFREGLTANTEIVTGKKNLLQCLYYNTFSQLRNS